MSVRSILAFGGTALVALGLSLPLATGTAQASSMTAVDIINTYNLVVFGDLYSTSEVDGRAFISGDLNGTNSNYAIHNSSLTPSTAPALTVGGNLNSSVNVNGKGVVVAGNVGGIPKPTAAVPSPTFHSGSITANNGGDIAIGGNIDHSSVSGNFNGNGNLYVHGSITTGSNVTANGGSVYVGGTSNGIVNANGGGALHTGADTTGHIPDVATEASQMKTTLTKYSNYLGTLTNSTGNISIVGNKATFNAVTNGQGVSIFNVSGASLFSEGEFQFNNVANATAIIINVSGIGDTALTIGANFLNGIAQSLGTKAIWNFTDATNIHITSQFGGTILALLANVTTSANIEGSLIAASVTQGAEIHYDGQGLIPTPVPAALPLFGVAIGGLASWRKLRGRKNQSRLAA